MSTTVASLALRQAREQVLAQHDTALSGRAFARALADATDRALAPLWPPGAGSGLALVALGGYGRGELSPHSDIDLMVLHDGRADAAAVAEPLFYALWDSGVSVGHAVRSVKQCIALARDNLEAETSFLLPRLIAGDPELYERFCHLTIAATRKRAHGFVAAVVEMVRARHAANGSATSQLEPNIKEGAGGLRDLHVLDWMGAAFGDLLAEGVVAATDSGALEDAAEMLHRVRAHLHLSSGRANDVLLFEYQRPLARSLCYLDGARPAEDAFMRDLFAATRTVEQAVTAALAELSARTRSRHRPGVVGPFGVIAGRVVVSGAPADFTANPEHAVEIFTLGAPLAAEARAWLDDGLKRAGSLPWTAALRRAFFALLRTGDARALERADHAGLLSRVLPEWDAVRCQPQHNAYHRHTVDAHLFAAVEQAAGLLAGGDDDVAHAAAEITDPDGLLLSALLHDVGKGTDEDHSIRGEQVAADLLDRMGVAGLRRETVLWLVRNHLLLVDAATRRDLSDENFVVDLAARIGDAQRARMLFVLTVADGIATGPTGWSPWKAALVRELYAKVAHVLARGDLVSTDALDLARHRTRELLKAASRHPDDAVREHIEAMPRAYVLAFPTQVLLRHVALMLEPPSGTQVRALVSLTEEPTTYDYEVVAADRPGLFAKVSGALALSGVNIVSAQAFTRADGIAIESFRCVTERGDGIEAARWRHITVEIERALQGKLSLPVRLAERRRAYPPGRARAKPARTQVVVDNDASHFSTVIEVHAPDRIGLLYDLTSTLADLTLDIQTAKLATHGDQAVDVFYVRDLEGQKVRDPEQIAEIERAVLQAVVSRD